MDSVKSLLDRHQEGVVVPPVEKIFTTDDGASAYENSQIEDALEPDEIRALEKARKTIVQSASQSTASMASDEPPKASATPNRARRKGAKKRPAKTLQPEYGVLEVLGSGLNLVAAGLRPKEQGLLALPLTIAANGFDTTGTALQKLGRASHKVRGRRVLRAVLRPPVRAGVWLLEHTFTSTSRRGSPAT